MHKSASITASSHAGRILNACIRVEGLSRTSTPNRLYIAAELHTEHRQQPHLDPSTSLAQTPRPDPNTAVVALGVDGAAAELGALAAIVYQLLAGTMLSERSLHPGAQLSLVKESLSLRSYYPFGLGLCSDDASTVVDLKSPPVDCPASQQELVAKAVTPDVLRTDFSHPVAEAQRPVARWRACAAALLLLVLAVTASSMRADSSNGGSNLAASLRASSATPIVIPSESPRAPNTVPASDKPSVQHTLSLASQPSKSKTRVALPAAVIPSLRLQ